MKKLKKTKAICGKCQKVVPAETFEEGGRVFLKSECPTCGETVEDHVWDDVEIYEGMCKVQVLPGRADQIIVDTTRKCNLNCRVCFANANGYQGNNFEEVDLEKIKDYQIVFLSGGEPTTREDLPEIIRHSRKNGQRPLVFTNGIKLAKKSYAKKLKKAGLRSVLLQFDTLKEEDSEYIRGRKLVEVKKAALLNLEKLDIPTTVWTVVFGDRNLGDIKEIHDFLLGFSNVRTVSAIPIWRVGKFNKEDFVPPSKIIEKLCQIYGLEKKDFVETTRFVCNMDRFLAVFFKHKNRLFGKCMVKALVFPYKGKHIPLGKIFNLSQINSEIDKVVSGSQKKLRAVGFLGIFIFREVLLNFFRNKHFRAVALRFVINFRYFFIKRFLLISPFRFITVGIFPNRNNIDLDFIEPCNSHALSLDDYTVRPACLHYILEDLKNETQNNRAKKTLSDDTKF